MKTSILITKAVLLTGAAWLALGSVASAQSILDVKIGETANDYTGGVGGAGPELNGAYQESAAAVLGSANSWWNEYAYVSTTPSGASVVDNGDNALAGVALTVSHSGGTGTKTTSGTTPNFMFQNGSYQNAGGVYTISLTGLAADTEYEFVGYAARSSSSAGAAWAVTDGTLDSGTTVNDGTSMSITTGVGKSYSDFIVTTDGSGNLTVTDSGNPGTSITVLDGFQLEAVAVPEPGAWAMMLGGCGLLLALRRFRRSQAGR